MSYYDEPTIRRHRREPSIPVWLLVLLTVVAGVLIWRIWFANQAPEMTYESPPVTPRGDLAEDEKTTIELFKKVSPSVVHITTLAVRDDFLGFNIQKIPRGTGSGFIWDEKRGYVVTNYHVLEGADEARVTLADGRTTVRASLVGADPRRDIAVLQINTLGLKLRRIPQGTSHDLLVGQKVFAIGNPFGLDQTLTTGVVSGLGREVNTGRGVTLHGLIQTDAAINPGNSGGPLLDSAGRLIGVNTAILSPSGASAGIGFAIPVDDVRWIVTRIINRRLKGTPSLGIELVPDHITAALGIDGVLFYRVHAGGAAQKAGLVPTRFGPFGRVVLGDIIVAIDGKLVRSRNELLNVLAGYEPGDRVTLTIIRGNQRLNVDVVLGKE